MDWLDTPISKRLLDKVEFAESGCWNNLIDNPKAKYPQFSFSGRKGISAHRAAYEEWVGLIPDGYEVDHVCFNKRCVNPSHLEAVTSEENKRRQGQYYKNSKTHCKSGHEFTKENTRIQPNGYRECIECSRISAIKHYNKLKDAGNILSWEQHADKYKYMCKNGHSRTASNTIYRPDGRIECRDCAIEVQRRRRFKRAAIKN